MTGEDDEEHREEQASFTGECTCDHEPEEHGWGSFGCDAEDEDGNVCPCGAGWEE